MAEFDRLKTSLIDYLKAKSQANKVDLNYLCQTEPAHKKAAMEFYLIL